MGTRSDAASPAPARLAAAAVLAGAALVLLAAPPWHGPILFTLSPGHGIDLGDVAALGAGVLAAALARPLLMVHRARAGPLARTDIALAALALIVGVIGLLRISGAGAPAGGFDAAAPAAVVAAGAWAGVAAVIDPELWPRTVRTTVGRATVVLLAGLLVDAFATPSGTLFGTAALSAHLALTARRPLGRGVFASASAAMLLLSAASLADIAGIDVTMSRSGGGAFRSAALVLVLGTGTVLEWTLPASSTRAR